MFKMILDKKPNELLENFLQEYNRFYAIDIEHSRKLIKLQIKMGADAPYQKFLVENWYKSLKTSQPAFELYNHNQYFVDLWNCWVVYSRSYLKSLKKHNSLDQNRSIFSILFNINNVADLGCGLAYTTASLKEIFPNANVYGTNLEETAQYKFCQFMAQKYNFKIVNHVDKLPKIDFLFASEYYEHIYDALDELDFTINKISPRYFYIANSFNTISYGHFESYKDKNCCGVIDQKDISKKFNDLLKSRGYVKIKTKLWNNKPMLWTNDQTTISLIHSK